MTNVKKKDLSSKSASASEGLSSYFKGVRSEWGKITWPEKRQVMVETVVVLAVVILFTAAVYVVDIVFKGLLDLIPTK